MKQAIAYLNKQNPLLLAGGVALIIGVVYYLARKTVSDVVTGAGGLVSGNNAITESAKDFDGNVVDAYQGKGVLGTLGATVNAITGGAAASVGSWIGGLLATDYASEDLYYTVTFPNGDRHAVGSTTVSKDGYFNKTVPPYTNSRWRIGTDATGKRVAKAA